MKSLVLVSIFILFSCCSFAGQVDSVRAKKIAAGFFLKKGEKVDINTLQLVTFNKKYKSKLKTSSFTGENLYIINREEPGFIIISGYDNVQPVLGFSFEYNFNPENIPPALKEWISWREAEIEYLADSRQKAAKEIINQWEILESEQVTAAIEDYSEPLIKTFWGQGVLYNDSCPVDINSDYSNDKVPVGCVATAMAQVMKYWEYPASGSGNHSYIPEDHPEYGKQSAYFSTAIYNWRVMTRYALNEDAGNQAITEISKIMYHCGVSVNMDYGPDASSAMTSASVNSLKNYFKYKSTATYINKSGYTNEAWNNTIRNEIISYRPVILRGSASNNTGGHAYVCDGYYGTEYFHINWGWNSSYNGYFSFKELTPGSDNFSYYQSAVIGIVPNNSSCAVYPGMVSLSPVSGSSSHFWITSNTTWTVSDDQSWLDVATTSGTGYKKVVITANSANNTGVDRTATITVTANGLDAKTISVTQLSASSALPNLYPYKPANWGNKLVVSSKKGTLVDDVIHTNDTVYLDYSYLNGGSASTSCIFTTWISLDDVIIRESVGTASLPPTNYFYMRDYMLGMLSAGTHTVSIKTDALNDIQESDETDNVYTRTFIVYETTNTFDINGNNDKIKIYPDPVIDILNINFRESCIRNIKIINSGGICVLKKVISGDIVQIPVSYLSQGVYIMQISTDSGLKSLKFIKQ